MDEDVKVDEKIKVDENVKIDDKIKIDENVKIDEPVNFYKNINQTKKSMKQLKRPNSLISHWFPVEMLSRFEASYKL